MHFSKGFIDKQKAIDTRLKLEKEEYGEFSPITTKREGEE